MLLDECILSGDPRINPDGGDYPNGLLDIGRTIMRIQNSVPPGDQVDIECLEPEYTCQSTWHVIRPMRIRARGGSWDRDVYGTRFRWLPGFVGNGIETHYPGSYAPDPAAGSLLTMHGCCISGPGWLAPGTDSTCHGLYARTRPVLTACTSENWAGKGFVIDNPTLPSGAHAVADFISMFGCYVQNCGGSGIYLHGPDSQIGLIMRCGAVNCGLREGPAAACFWDDSFFGNKWICCDANSINRANGQPLPEAECPVPFRATNQNTSAFFDHCYTEGGRGSEINAPSIVFGGKGMTLKAGFNGVFFNPQTNGYMSIGPGIRQFNALNPADVVSTRVPDAAVERVALAFDSTDESSTAQPWRLQHAGATKFWSRWWCLVFGNNDNATALRIADAKCQSMDPGSVWAPQRRFYIGSTGSGSLGNSVEFGDGPPSVLDKHLRGDRYFDRSGANYRFDGAQWVQQ